MKKWLITYRINQWHARTRIVLLAGLFIAFILNATIALFVSLSLLFFMIDSSLPYVLPLFIPTILSEPNNFLIDENSPLIKKFRAALRQTRHIFIIGASNTIDNLKRTNDWAYTINTALLYQKSWFAKVLNARGFKTKWQIKYQKDFKIGGYPYLSQENPLKELALAEGTSNFFEDIILRAKIRQGNCCSQAQYLAHYLWKYPGSVIHRIEVVGAEEFDHAFVIINRPRDSLLNNHSTWKDAWLIDPWRADEFYPASEFNEKMLATLAFCLEQYPDFIARGACSKEKLRNEQKVFNKYVVQYLKAPHSLSIPLKRQIDIDTRQPFPKFQDPYREIEDCFQEIRGFTEKDLKNYHPILCKHFAKHKMRFAPCLKDILEGKRKMLKKYNA
ncbi:MAG: hypothetical protein JSS07_05020 [Proteobacteria bacterium]|nr:hypothetical protein [Pseudomonadota bacterium]